MPAQKTLTHGEFTLTASVASRICAIAAYTVPRGRAIVLKRTLQLRFKMLDGAATEMPITSLFRFAFRPATETVWSRYVSEAFPYEAWSLLSLAEQQNNQYNAACQIDLGIDYLCLTAGETLLVEAYDTSGTVDATYTKLFVDYALLNPEQAAPLVAKRQKVFGV